MRQAMTEFPIPWRLNLAIAALQVTAALVIFRFTAAATEGWQLLLLALCFAVVGNSIYAMMHEAEHGILAPSRRLNDAMGTFLALFFPASFHLLRQGHLGHHFRNRSDDEAFDHYFAGENPLWKWLQLYGILSGFFWATIVLSNVVIPLVPAVLQRRYFSFDRPTAAFMDALNRNYLLRIRLECAAAIAFQAVIVWTFEVPLASYVLVYVGFGITWSAMQYVHHFGTDRDVVHGSRNLWIWKPIDLAWLNHNWHHTHHERPTVPWLYLPKLSRRMNATREFLIWHYLRMWRGPRFTDQHVENRYAGRIIR
jgi:fatty acid desaturase